MQPENWQILKPFPGYTSFSEPYVAREKAKKANKEGQWFKFLFNQCTDRVLVGTGTPEYIQPETPAKVTTSEAITPVAEIPQPKATDKQFKQLLKSQGFGSGSGHEESEGEASGDTLPFELESEAEKSEEEQDEKLDVPAAAPPPVTPPPRSYVGEKKPRYPKYADLWVKSKRVLKQRFLDEKQKRKAILWGAEQRKREKEGKEMSEDECPECSDCSDDYEFKAIMARHGEKMRPSLEKEMAEVDSAEAAKKKAELRKKALARSPSAASLTSTASGN
jgi:hypothetical protein